MASVSRRIKSLEAARFKGLPLIEVFRANKKKIKGKLIFANNSYRLNQRIIIIFAPHEKTTAHRQQQMEALRENKAKLLDSLNIGEKRKDDKLTRRSF